MIKKFTALASAGFVGLWLGITYVGTIAYPDGPIMKEPAWVGQAQEMQVVAVAGLLVCVISWLVLDYREHRDEIHDNVEGWRDA